MEQQSGSVLKAGTGKISAAAILSILPSTTLRGEPSSVICRSMRQWRGSVRTQASGNNLGPTAANMNVAAVPLIFDVDGNAVGLEDSFDFNGGPRYGWAEGIGMALIRSGRADSCGTSGDFRITAGVGR